MEHVPWVNGTALRKWRAGEGVDKESGRQDWAPVTLAGWADGREGEEKRQHPP